MYCSYCHTHLADDFAFCTNCGIETVTATDEQETVLRTRGGIQAFAQMNDTGKRQSHSETSKDGRIFFGSELSQRGIVFVERIEGRRTVILATNPGNGRIMEIRVKTKRNKGNWHSDTKEAEPIVNLPNPESETTFWAFVNLHDYKSEPTFWIAPDSWMRNDIWTAHQKYLAKRDGKRAKNDDSTHHSIDEGRLEQWLGRWELLGVS